MRTDRFEELLRKKLENYTPDYREEDLDRMFSHIQRHTAPSFWSQYGKLFSYSLAGITTAGLLFTIFYQNNQNQQLHEEITLLKNTAPKVETIIQTITKTDTVYLTKYIQAKGDETEKTVVLAQNQTDTIDKNQETKSNFVQTKSIEISQNIDNEAERKHQNEDSEIKTEQKSLSKKEIINGDIVKNQAPEKDNFYTKSNPVSEPMMKKEHEQSFINKQVEESPNSVQLPAGFSGNLTEISLNSLSIKPLSKYSSNYDLSDFKIKNNYRRITIAPNRRPKYDYQFPDVSLKNIRFRMGATAVGGMNKKGFGLTNEIMFNKNLSMGIGIGSQKIEGEDFNNDLQYDYKYGKEGIYEKKEKGEHPKQDFRAAHLPALPLNNEIRDIHLRNEIAYFPISLNYRKSLKKDFNWLFTVGTEIDFYVKESANFGIQLPNQQTPTEKPNRLFGYKFLQPSAFNNVFLSTGIEKSFGNYVLQFSPYIIGRFKDVKYRTEKYNFGFRFNALYQFGKK